MPTTPDKLHAHYADELVHVPSLFPTISPKGIEAMREARKKSIQPRLLAQITGLSESGVLVALKRNNQGISTPHPNASTPPDIGSFSDKKFSASKSGTNLP